MFPPSLAKIPTSHQYENHGRLEGWLKCNTAKRGHEVEGQEGGSAEYSETRETKSGWNKCSPDNKVQPAWSPSNKVCVLWGGNCYFGSYSYFILILGLSFLFHIHLYGRAQYWHRSTNSIWFYYWWFSYIKHVPIMQHSDNFSLVNTSISKL